MRMTWVTKLGLVLIAVALIPWACWTAWDSTRTWFLVKDLPISLSNGSHYSTGWVTTNMGGWYSIYITADYPEPNDNSPRSEPERKLACQIGFNDPRKEPCPAPPLWKFHWTLLGDGSIVQGGSDETIGAGRTFPAGSIDREIGQFSTRAGHLYKFDLDVLFDNPRLEDYKSAFDGGRG